MRMRIPRRPKRPGAPADQGQPPATTSDDLKPVQEVLAATQAAVDDGDLTGAMEILNSALAERPGNVSIRLTKAHIFALQSRWHDSARVWHNLAKHWPRRLRPKHWAQAITAHRRINALEEADRLLDTALASHPDNARLLRHRGEIAMAREQWDRALDALAAYAYAQDQPEFILRPRESDWFEAAWHEVAMALIDRGTPQQDPFTAQFYEALGLVLLRTGFFATAEQLLTARLASAADTAPTSAEQDLKRLRDLAVAKMNPPAPRRRSPDLEALVSQLPGSPDISDGLGPLRVLRAVPGSALDRALRSTRYIEGDQLDPMIQQRERERGWPQADPDRDRLTEDARRLADEYGRAHAQEPHLPADTLADAVYLAVYHAASELLPLIDLADGLAESTPAGEPVVLEVQATRFVFLNGHTDADSSLIQLYFALLARGVNAFLCLPDSDGTGAEPLTMKFCGRWSAMETQTTYSPSTPSRARRRARRVALVPAGVRLFEQVRKQWPDASVFESGSLVGAFAYDRYHRKPEQMRVNTRLHPDSVFRPEVEIELAATGITNVEGSLHESAPVGGTWLDWLHAATGDFVEHLARTAAEQVRNSRINEAHVADYLLPDAVVVGDAVRRTGGRVVLHPHSSNPVHLTARRADSFDEVLAVTREGTRMWADAFPDKVARHAPTSVIKPGTPRAFEPGQPLSVVLFGGVATMGRTPLIDLDALGQSYVDLLDGIAGLQETHNINVHFKPRGTNSDTPAWLFRAAGRRANWKPVYVHGKRLELPNQVFVSVAVGSTALLEGLADGKPGLVVRDFPVRDYTTLGEDTFPIVPHDEAVEILAGLTEQAGYESLLKRGLRFAEDELGFSL